MFITSRYLRILQDFILGAMQNNIPFNTSNIPPNAKCATFDDMCNKKIYLALLALTRFCNRPFMS